MMMKNTFYSVLIAFALLSTAHAVENESKAQVNSSKQGTYNSNWGFYLGLGAGYSANGHKAPVEGVPSQAKILGSYLMDSADLLFDLGLGNTSHAYKTTNAKRPFEAGGAMAEFAIRSVFEGGWQAGLVLNDYFNQGKAFGSTHADAHFGGLQLLKEFNPTGDMALRVGGKLQTQLNNAGAPVNMAQVEVQIGFGANRSSTQNPAAVTQTVKAKKVETVDKKTSENATISIDSKKGSEEKIATFDVGADQLTAEDKAYLYKLGKSLKENTNQFSQLTIRGFADISGQEKMNQVLSEKRAQAVKNFFVQEVGLPASVIETKGEGEAPSATLISTDRRIEIDLHGVKDTQEIQNILR